MEYLGVSFELGNVPQLEPDFIPFAAWARAYLRGAGVPVSVAVEREGGKVTVRHTRIHGTAELHDADRRYLERYVKFLLWSVGGWRVYIRGADALARELQSDYAPGGAREFDVQFMQDVYERPFEIVVCEAGADFPAEHDSAVRIGGHTDGCRIGFDAGGSDRKVSAVVDGKVVYSEEAVWLPKLSEDPQYQYDGILDSFRTAASKMPRVDAIGVSSAGVFIGNSPMVSSLFIKVPRSRREEVKTIYDRAAAEIGAPIVVANDGDVTALAGSMSLGVTGVMGLAMGTSEAVGYVDREGNVLGWFNELAFAPVDLNEHAMRDEWSGDLGVGCKYFSQDAVLKLAPAAGIELDKTLSLAEQLKQAQALMEQGDVRAEAIWRTIGCYLAHTLRLYADFYDIRHLLVLGRVVSGRGGEVLIDECRRVLREDYPELTDIEILLPDEKTRRVGQSVAAASLPQIGG